MTSQRARITNRPVPLVSRLLHLPEPRSTDSGARIDEFKARVLQNPTIDRIPPPLPHLRILGVAHQVHELPFLRIQ